MRTDRTPVVAAVLGLVLACGPAPGQEPAWFPGSTVKVRQLTGDVDAPRRMPTATLTQTRFGIAGTDLGSSFEHRGKLWFLFGDTAGRPGDRDVIGWTEARDPSAISLDFHRADDGKFLPLTVPGIGQGAFEVPTCGISAGSRMIVLFTTDHSEKKTMGRSVLAASDDDGKTFRALGELSRLHFINAAMAHGLRSASPGLPAERGVLVFGSGDYRKSSPRLCFVEGDRFGDPSARRFFAGMSEKAPRWSPKEADAAPLFDHPVVGEISVAWIEPLARWVMLYNSSDPRGIVMRTAPMPWGPWSAPSVIFDPWRDGGYPGFMHVSWKTSRVDAFHDAGREDRFGGEYGPFLIPRFTTGAADRCTLYFTLSTWNPYQVILARADVGRPAAPESRRATTVRTLPGSEGWTTTPGLFKPFERDGRRFVTTHAAEGDKTTGFSHYGFTTARDGVVELRLHGGHAEVVLVVASGRVPDAAESAAAAYDELKRGVFGEVVEAVAGPGSNKHEIHVRWSVDRFAGKPLRLFVVDRLTTAWGFVSVSEIAIEGVEEPPKTAAAPDHDVAYTLTLVPGPPVAVRVAMQVRGETSGKSRLRIARSWAGVENCERFVHALVVRDAAGRACRVDRDPAAPDSWDVAHEPDAVLTAEYELRPLDHDPLAGFKTHFEPVVRDDLIHLIGETCLIYPAWLETRGPLDIGLSWSGFRERGFATVSSFDADGDRIRRAPQAFRHAIFLAGGVRVHDRDIRGGKLRVALAGDQWDWKDDELVSCVEKVIGIEREFVNDFGDPFFLVTVVPMGPRATPTSLSIGGTAMTNCFALYLAPGMSLSPESVHRSEMLGLLAHEYFHTWNGGKIALEQPEEVGYWFSEGFTEFYAGRLLRRAGLIDDAAWMKAVNQSLERFWRSPAATQPADVIRRDFWKRREVEELPLLRGRVVALILDEEIRRSSKGARNLDDFFREQLADSRSGGKCDTARLIERIARWTSPELAERLRAVVIDGALPDPPAAITEPAAERLSGDVPQYRLKS